MFRLYINDDGRKLYLMDWIVAEGVDHPQFTTIRELAMTFERFNACLKYHNRLSKIGYKPHAE